MSSKASTHSPTTFSTQVISNGHKTELVAKNNTDSTEVTVVPVVFIVSFDVENLISIKDTGLPIIVSYLEGMVDTISFHSVISNTAMVHGHSNTIEEGRNGSDLTELQGLNLADYGFYDSITPH